MCHLRKHLGERGESETVVDHPHVTGNPKRISGPVVSHPDQACHIGNRLGRMTVDRLPAGGEQEESGKLSHLNRFLHKHRVSWSAPIAVESAFLPFSGASNQIDEWGLALEHIGHFVARNRKRIVPKQPHVLFGGDGEGCSGKPYGLPVERGGVRIGGGRRRHDRRDHPVHFSSQVASPPLEIAFERGHRRPGRQQRSTKTDRQPGNRPAGYGHARTERPTGGRDQQATDQGREKGGDRRTKPVVRGTTNEGQPRRDREPGDPCEERDPERNDPQQPAKLSHAGRSSGEGGRPEQAGSHCRQIEEEVCHQLFPCRPWWSPYGARMGGRGAGPFPSGRAAGVSVAATSSAKKG